MGHLKGADPQRTVLMVQVENEPGAWGSVRDFSPAAQKLFEGPVPDTLLSALGKERTGAGWSAAFGEDADEFFHAWSVAHFIRAGGRSGRGDLPTAAVRQCRPAGPPEADAPAVL